MPSLHSCLRSQTRFLGSCIYFSSPSVDSRMSSPDTHTETRSDNRNYFTAFNPPPSPASRHRSARVLVVLMNWVYGHNIIKQRLSDSVFCSLRHFPTDLTETLKKNDQDRRVWDLMIFDLKKENQFFLFSVRVKKTKTDQILFTVINSKSQMCLMLQQTTHLVLMPSNQIRSTSPEDKTENRRNLQTFSMTGCENCRSRSSSQKPY